jgi:hypothetical protein
MGLTSQGALLPPRTDPKSATMKSLIQSVTLLLATTCLLAATGCKRKEKVFEMKTPAGGIEVERDKKSGDVDIKVGDEKK